MINFILCDDKEKYNKDIKNIINSLMMNNNADYQVHIFNDSNKKLNEIISTNFSNKIYILDIELPNGSGLDIAKKIRNQGDWESIIIINTVHYALSHSAYKRRLLIFDFINKYNDFPLRMKQTINEALNIIKEKQTLIFSINRITYRLSLNEVVYIEKDAITRKLLIKTIHNDYLVNTSLLDIENKLNRKFSKINRSIIVNDDHIKKIDYQNLDIEMDNGDIVGPISLKFKKELKKRDFC